MLCGISDHLFHLLLVLLELLKCTFDSIYAHLNKFIVFISALEKSPTLEIGEDWGSILACLTAAKNRDPLFWHFFLRQQAHFEFPSDRQNFFDVDLLVLKVLLEAINLNLIWLLQG